MTAEFDILGDIKNIETIAVGRGVHIRRHLDHSYGKGHWRKMKGTATVRLADGTWIAAGPQTIAFTPPTTPVVYSGTSFNVSLSATGGSNSNNCRIVVLRPMMLENESCCSAC